MIGGGTISDYLMITGYLGGEVIRIIMAAALPRNILSRRAKKRTIDARVSCSFMHRLKRPVLILLMLWEWWLTTFFSSTFPHNMIDVLLSHRRSCLQRSKDQYQVRLQNGTDTDDFGDICTRWHRGR